MTDQYKGNPQNANTFYSRNRFLTIFSPGKAVAKLRIGKLVKSPCSSNTEVTPDVLIAPEIQFLNSSWAGLKTLLKNEEYERTDFIWKEENI